MKTLMIAALAALFMTTAAFGVTWNYYDFGVGAEFDEHQNTSDIAFPGHGYVPSPGEDDEGGELYDIEGLNFTLHDDSVFITLTSSFGTGVVSSYWGQTFYTGDLFFGFDGSNDQFAIDMSTGNLWSVSSWNYITDKPGSYYNNLAIRLGVGAYSVAGGTDLGAVDNMMTLYQQYEQNPMYAYEQDTWVWEFRFAANQLGVNFDDYSYIDFHNTVECGNDLLDKRYDLGVVPEPGTMILLGLGLLGVGAGIRRKK